MLLPSTFSGEVIDVALLGLPLQVPLLTALAALAHQFLLLGIHRDDGLSLCLADLGQPIKILELRIAVRAVAPLERAAVSLVPVAQILEDSVDRPFTDGRP